MSAELSGRAERRVSRGRKDRLGQLVNWGRKVPLGRLALRVAKASKGRRALLAHPVPQEQWVRPVRRASRESLPSKSVSSRGV